MTAGGARSVRTLGVNRPVTTSESRSRPRRGFRRIPRLVRWMAYLSAGLVAALVAAFLVVQQHLSGELGRIPDAFAGLQDRPSASAPGSENVLVVAMPEADPAGQVAVASTASVSVMLVHFDAARHSPTVLVFPDSLRVAVPGQGPRPLREVAGLGSPSLIVQAVEASSGVRVDHLAVVDWAAFDRLDALAGGVQVDVLSTARTGSGGVQHFVDERQIGSGDVSAFLGDPQLGARARAVRQAAFLRGLMDATLHQELRKQPWNLYRFLNTVASGTSVDSGWSVGGLRSLVWSLRSLRSLDIAYLVPPAVRAGAGASADQARSLWDAVRNDDMVTWLSRHPQEVVPLQVH
jgi:LytR_cpsA_psr family